MNYLQLRDGTEIPQLGFGTAGISSNRVEDVIQIALDVGFRRFDTASMYGNEQAIGRAIQQSDIDRSEIFITTKLWDGGDFSYENTIAECHKSLERLGLDYIDMYLHHWPVEAQRLKSWEAMESLVDGGITRYIGVSNYTKWHLKELFDHADIAPELNQVEFNPFLFQEDLLEYCQRNQVILEAYSPFAKGKKLDEPNLEQLAQSYGKTPAQILIRWGLQLGISLVPKASSRDHIIQNIDVFDFELEPEHMEQLNILDEGYRLEWDPTNVR